VWLHVGLLPKSENKFLNDKAIIDDLGVSPYFEALGTEEITFIGPGEAPEKMFGRPLTYELKGYNTDYSAYGPFLWTYDITNELGIASFEVSFDHDFIEDFVNIFGSMEGFNSIEDVVLYIRAFTTYFEWEDFAIDTPDQYICSKDGTIFDGSTSKDNYDFTELSLRDSTYIEGLIRLRKKDIAIATNDYYSYQLPDDDVGSGYEPITMQLLVTEASPIPSGIVPSINSLTKAYISSELEPLPVNLLEDDITYYATIQFYTPSGTLVETLQKAIVPGYNDGMINIDNETVITILSKLGPGVSTIKLHILESEYYKSSPMIIIPLEILPANWVKFGEKNSIIDLIDPYLLGELHIMMTMKCFLNRIIHS
jgi:hypothetical protein